MNPVASFGKWLQEVATSQVSHTGTEYRDGSPDHSSDRDRGGGRAGGEKFSGAMFYKSLADQDYSKIRASSRLAYWESAQARSLIDRLATTSIGTGLVLESSPVWDIIDAYAPKSEKERSSWTRRVELEFDLFMKSTELDATGRMNGYQLQDFHFRAKLKDGETWAIMRYQDGDASRTSPLSIQFIDPDQVCSPYDTVFVHAAKLRGNTICDGIELDSMGREVAIYVQDDDTKTFTRIEFNGKTRRFILHPGIFESIGQHRGLPLLAPVVHELQKLVDYTVAEIEAAVVNAVMAIWIEPGPNQGSSQPFQGIQDKSKPSGSQGGGAYELPQATVLKPGMIVQKLKAGEKLQSFDTKRPNVNFADFVQAVTKDISSSMGIPIEVLQMVFGQNYSASRASLILYWMTIETKRSAEVAQFDQPVYEAWFSEKVAIDPKFAPGFNDSPLIRQAWLNSYWVGASMPSIDPLKDAKADTERLLQGATTHERVAQKYNGSDFEENARRLKKEAGMLPETTEEKLAKLTPAPSNPVTTPQKTPAKQ